MNDTIEAQPIAVASEVGSGAHIPLRLHHNAWVVADQERTRVFYEDIIGMPMTQFWIENTVFEGENFVLSHAFYGLADGGALAFFCLADSSQHDRFKAKPTQVFTHIAVKVDQPTQDAILARLEAAKYPQFGIEHGYCKSLYATDPDGLRVEFAVDHPKIDEIVVWQGKTARDTFKRWLAGDHTSNNDLR